MKVRELIEELKNYNGDDEVCIGTIQALGGAYVNTICRVKEQEVTIFFGKDSKMVVITGSDQIGKV